MARIAEEAGVAPTVPGIPSDVEAVRRTAADGTAYLLVLNHTGRDVEVPVSGRELLTDTEVTGTLRLAAGGSAVVREA